MNDHEASLTIRDAARATGLSVKAVQRRIERGTLPAQLHDGVRRIPLGALLEAHLVVADGSPAALRPAVASPGMLAELERRVAELEARLAALERPDRDDDGDGDHGDHGDHDDHDHDGDGKPDGHGRSDHDGARSHSAGRSNGHPARI